MPFIARRAGYGAQVGAAACGVGLRYWATMPSPPTAPGTVTEPIFAQRALRARSRTRRRSRGAGLHVQEAPAARDRRVDRAGVRCGVAQAG